MSTIVQAFSLPDHQVRDHKAATADVPLYTDLFQGDQDFDLVSDINDDFFEDEIMNEDDKTMNQDNSDENGEDVCDCEKDLLQGDIDELRAKFDDGRGDKLFAQYRAQEGEYQGQYKVILLGALMMRVGAKIQDHDFQHLRDLVPQINCNEGYTMAIWDDGFRGPGKRQFLAAMNHYKAGVPRNFGAARYD